MEQFGGGGYIGGILSRGILSGGFCPRGDFVQGDFVRGDFVLEPYPTPTVTTSKSPVRKHDATPVSQPWWLKDSLPGEHSCALGSPKPDQALFE